jgi:hypothetical protein
MVTLQGKIKQQSLHSEEVVGEGSLLWRWPLRWLERNESRLGNSYGKR